MRQTKKGVVLMKIRTLLQSFLLTAGLLLGGTSAALADHAHSTVASSGDYHSLSHDNRGAGHTSQWSSGHHNPGSSHLGYRGEHREKHRPNQHDNYGHGLRWHCGKHDGHGDGRDHKVQWQHGKYDGRDYTGHKEHRSRYGGFGYTGRS
jgi:hypothetical protein